MPSEAAYSAEAAASAAKARLAKEGRSVWYVYLLESDIVACQRDVGITADLKRRLTEHNAGKSAHTSKFKPWRIVTYVAFSDEEKAASFERYLKSGSTHSPASAYGSSIAQR
jgi:putative endonuclease